MGSDFVKVMTWPFSDLFTGGDAPAPQPLPEAPTIEDAEAQAEEDLERRPGAVGAAETISAGLLTEEATTEKKTLLGS